MMGAFLICTGVWPEAIELIRSSRNLRTRCSISEAPKEDRPKLLNVHRIGSRRVPPKEPVVSHQDPMRRVP
jgi:hypothetical protein